MHYYKISGETPPEKLSQADNPCLEIMLLVRTSLDSITHTTANCASEIGKQNQEIRHSIDDLSAAQEKQEMLKILANIVEKANAIFGTVESSRNELLATKLSLDSLNAELQETRLQLNEDPLTGAQNRRAMDKILAREVALSIRTGARLSVTMIDIDHFKKINDDYGHD
ncbi:GGDEF domain-containing protein, partial [Sulfurirhabdus autotrophica]